MAEPSEGSVAGVDKLVGTEGRAKRNGLLEGKPQISQVLEFRRGIIAIAKQCEIGEKKYGRGNWANGMPINEIVDSMMRHMLSVMSGEEVDPETGRPHVDAIAWGGLLLAEQWHKNKEAYDPMGSHSHVIRYQPLSDHVAASDPDRRTYRDTLIHPES